MMMATFFSSPDTRLWGRFDWRGKGRDCGPRENPARVMICHCYVPIKQIWVASGNLSELLRHVEFMIQELFSAEKKKKIKERQVPI